MPEAYLLGLDLSINRLNKCQIRGIRDVVCGDAEHLPFREYIFDVTLSTETIEHVYNPEQMIQEMIQITKNRIIITTPSLDALRVRFR